jgi:hypothetical protein
MVNEDWVRAEQECVARGNPQPLISWQRRDRAQIQVRIGLIRVKIGCA